MGDTSNPSADPTPIPTPDPTDPNPIPEPGPIPDPVPIPEPTPEPTPDPAPDPVPDPVPDPEPTPDPDPATPKDKVDPQVVDVLTINMLETTASSASFAMANLYQHQVNHARRLDSMAEACLGKMIKRLSTTSPMESVATSKIFHAESDSSIGSLLAQLSSGQIGAKIAQSTPGELSAEIAKIGAAIASIHSVVGGIVAVLQQSLIDGTNGIPVTPNLAKKSQPKPDNKKPVPTPSVPKPDPIDNAPDWVGSHKFPTVTIRY